MKKLLGLFFFLFFFLCSTSYGQGVCVTSGGTAIMPLCDDSSYLKVDAISRGDTINDNNDAATVKYAVVG